MALKQYSDRQDLKTNSDFKMRTEDFQFLKKHAYEKVGIVLSDFKQDMVYSRLVRRLRILKLKDFSEYCHYLNHHGAEELTFFVNAITTNFTSFFREQHHFEFLENTVIPEWRNRRDDEGIRIWSAGCSTGEEPYSIAMTLIKTRATFLRNLKILATDVDTNVLQTGFEGLYECSKATGLSDDMAHQWCETLDLNGVPVYGMSEELKKMISFKQLNLLATWPIKKQYDLIFCRNVVIYFDKETQEKLFQRYFNQLKPGGYLIIGHSETLTGIFDSFEAMGGTIYRKPLELRVNGG